MSKKYTITVHTKNGRIEKYSTDNERQSKIIFKRELSKRSNESVDYESKEV